MKAEQGLNRYRPDALSAVRILISDNDTLEQSPRSIGFELPKNGEQLSNILQELSAISVETHISYDKKRSILVVTTGTSNSPLNPLYSGDPDAMQQLIERHANGAFIHNHPGPDQPMPSPGDWVGLAHLLKRTGVTTSWIVSPKGIARFSFENKSGDKVSAEEIEKMKDDWYIEELWTRYGIVGQAENPKQLQQASELNQEFAGKIGGKLEFAAWTEKAKTSEFLEEFLRLCK